jgi:hypothetical protein
MAHVTGWYRVSYVLQLLLINRQQEQQQQQQQDYCERCCGSAFSPL